MQAAHRADRFRAGAQPEVIGVSQDDARVEFIFEPLGAHAFDRALRSDRHKNGRLNYRTPRAQNSGPGIARLLRQLSNQWV